jgi:predicted outer membrane repeat protein
LAAASPQRTYALTLSTALLLSGELRIYGNGHIIKADPAAFGFSVEEGSNIQGYSLRLTGFQSAAAFKVKGTLGLSSSEIYENHGGLGTQASVWVTATGRFSAKNTTIRDNSAIRGAGIYNNGGFVGLENVTLARNTALQYGGGLLVYGAGQAILTDCTISGNVATDYFGGGIYAGGTSETWLTNVTIARNDADRGGGLYTTGPAVVHLRDSIVDENTGEHPQCSGSIRSRRGNLFGTSHCKSIDEGSALTPPDLINVSAQLGPLESPWSGAPLVHLPSAGSKAIDRIQSGPCSNTYDQLGNKRPTGLGCDIGAVEQ